MASIQFFIRNKKNPTKVVLRMYISRNNQPYTATNIIINGKIWSEKKQRLKGNDEYTIWVNQTLDNLHSFLLQSYSKDYALGIITDSEWLQKSIDKFFSRPNNKKTISEEFKDFIAENPLIKGKRLSKNTLQNYNQVANIIKEFKDVIPIKIDLTYHSNFIKYLKTKKYSPNTISKHISVLKSFLIKLDNKGISIHNSVKKDTFFIPAEIEVDNIYLNESRISSIKNLKIEKEHLIKIRDNFILGLRTGLRVSDFLNLHDYNIQGNFIEVQTKKTDSKVIIPIHSDVREVLERNNGLPENISDQKFNKHIKDICKVAGFDTPTIGAKRCSIDGVTRKQFGKYPFYKLVSSHICRRSFATNLYGKLPNLTIMQITGHKTERSFLKYIKTTTKEHAEILKKYWENEN